MSDEINDLDSTFRCTQFACLLTAKACLRRQAEVWRKPGRNAGGKRFVVEKVMHPHCASGVCAQGNAIRAQFPGHVPDRAADPRAAPRLDLVTQEPAMSKTVCAECRSPSKHVQGCSKPEKRIPAPSGRPSAAKPAPEPRADWPAPTPMPRVVRRGADALPEPGQLPDDYLVACVAEARDRVQRRRAEADRLEQLLDAPVAPSVRSAG